MRFIALIAIILVAGCHQHPPDHHAELKTKLAALHVLTTGASYHEFRTSRLALESTLTTHSAELGPLTNQIAKLSSLLSATDCVWRSYNRFDELLTPSEPGVWQSIVLLDPTIQAKPLADRSAIDYHGPRYVRLGLAAVKTETSALLTALETR